MPKRKHFTSSQKAQIVLETLKEEKTVSQLASEHSVHPNQIHKWKKHALEHFAQLFENEDKDAQAQAATHEKQVNDLYTEIGKLSTQLAWLKKKSGLHDA